MENKLALLIFVLAGAALLSGGCITPSAPANSTVNVSFTVGTGSNSILGNPSAPLTIVEFTDYECPFCARHANETFPLIESDYIDTGKVKYYLRDFPIHADSANAALAARCAGEQGKYWEMHGLLFSKQAEWAALSDTQLAAKFKDYAFSLGMNENLFSSCYSASMYGQRISSDRQDGESYGISGTPSSVIIYPKTANESRLLAVLNKYPSYSSQGYISLARNPRGEYYLFIKGAFAYPVFQDALNAAG